MTYLLCKRSPNAYVVTANNQQYHHNWHSIKTDHEENKILKSGMPVKITRALINLTLYDYYGTHSDYENTFNKANLSIVEKVHPLGGCEDGVEWGLEKTVLPYVIYVLKKTL